MDGRVNPATGWGPACILKIVYTQPPAAPKFQLRVYGRSNAMLTIEGFIAVVSLMLTAFGLGYAIGRNSDNTRE